MEHKTAETETQQSFGEYHAESGTYRQDGYTYDPNNPDAGWYVTPEDDELATPYPVGEVGALVALATATPHDANAKASARHGSSRAGTHDSKATPGQAYTASTRHLATELNDLEVAEGVTEGKRQHLRRSSLARRAENVSRRALVDASLRRAAGEASKPQNMDEPTYKAALEADGLSVRSFSTRASHESSAALLSASAASSRRRGGGGRSRRVAGAGGKKGARVAPLAPVGEHAATDTPTTTATVTTPATTATGASATEAGDSDEDDGEPGDSSDYTEYSDSEEESDGEYEDEDSDNAEDLPLTTTKHSLSFRYVSQAMMTGQRFREPNQFRVRASQFCAPSCVCVRVGGCVYCSVCAPAHSCVQRGPVLVCPMLPGCVRAWPGQGALQAPGVHEGQGLIVRTWERAGRSWSRCQLVSELAGGSGARRRVSDVVMGGIACVACGF